MNLKIIKIGGKLVEDDKALDRICCHVKEFYPHCILVHGGGSMAGEMSAKLGIPTVMHDGRRVTDKATLDVTVMTYAGLANKWIVAALWSKGIPACGLSGCDMGVITAHKRPVADVDWGFVGDIDAVDTNVIRLLLKNGMMPVFSPITCSKSGQLLNTNADSVASAVAIAMSRMYETELIYCFDKPGILADIADEQSVIPWVDKAYYRQLLEKKIIHSGMLPKLENAFKTLEAGVKTVRLTNPENLNGGTVIQ